ncbi:MAG TPA: amino acid permease, partial [Candidatus Berkiella sp.]|nr:amino acid permease [Candidatus Berkiella sp.]
VMLLTLWGFIGFESATTTAGDVEDPARIFPKAMVLGTLLVAVVYFISSVGIMGVIPGEILANSESPYADAAKVIFGGHWHVLISLIACFVCISAVNAWTLASGQIALGITKDRLMPRFFAKTNKHGAPVFALIFSCIGTLPLIYFTHSDNLAQKVNTIIDLSVTSFLFVYVICCMSFLKMIWQQKRSARDWQWYCGLFSLAFCLWVMASTPLKTLIICSLFVFSGLPIYLIRRKKLKVALAENLFQPAPATLASDAP